MKDKPAYTRAAIAASARNSGKTEFLTMMMRLFEDDFLRKMQELARKSTQFDNPKLKK